MSRNVLLTTMSTVNNKKRLNYYSDQKTGKFCDGVVSIEPGTKYFLSHDYGISDIVVIGSDETFFSGKDDISKMHLKDVDLNISNKIISELSAYEFFRYRISLFCCGKNDSFIDFAKQIPEERRTELNNMVINFIKSRGISEPKQWFNYIVNTKEAKNDLYNLIKENIESDFVEEDKEKHFAEGNVDIDDLEDEESVNLGMIEKTLQKERNKVKKSPMSRFDINWLILRIKNAINISSIQKEQYMQIIQYGLDESILFFEKEREVAKYKLVIDELKATISRLANEINVIKTNRVSDEFNYVKQYLYTMIDMDQQMMPAGNVDNLTIRFLPAKVENKGNKDVNLTEILDAIYDGQTDINLYIDMQGGSRTDGYVMNAIMTILQSDSSFGLRIASIVATDYEAGRIVSTICDETKNYRILDLVSGINSFIQYGRAELIKKYCDEIYSKDKRVTELANQMVKVDQGLSICSIQMLTDGIIEIYKLFKEPHTNDPVFDLIESEIKREYDGILDNQFDVDYAALCWWAYKKRFIQQAISIIEAKMPEYMAKSGVIYFCNNSNKTEILKILKDEYKNEIKKQKNKKKNGVYEFNDIQHYLIKHRSNTDYMTNCLNVGNKVNSLYWLYNDISKSRNEVNHVKDSASTGNLYEEYTNKIKKFLKLYDKIEEKVDKNNNVVLLTLNDIKGGIKQKAKDKKPVDIDVNYCPMFLADIKKNSIMLIAKSTQYHITADSSIVSAYKDKLKKLQYYGQSGSASQKEKEELKQNLLQEVISTKGEKGKIIVFADKKLFEIFGKEFMQAVSKNTDGLLYITRDSSRGWSRVNE